MGMHRSETPPRVDTILPVGLQQFLRNLPSYDTQDDMSDESEAGEVGLQQFLRNLPLTTPRPSCAPGKRSYDTQDDMSDESEAGEMEPQHVCVESFMI